MKKKKVLFVICGKGEVSKFVINNLDNLGISVTVIKVGENLDALKGLTHMPTSFYHGSSDKEKASKKLEDLLSEVKFDLVVCDELTFPIPSDLFELVNNENIICYSHWTYNQGDDCGTAIGYLRPGNAMGERLISGHFEVDDNDIDNTEKVNEYATSVIKNMMLAAVKRILLQYCIFEEDVFHFTKYRGFTPYSWKN